MCKKYFCVKIESKFQKQMITRERKLRKTDEEANNENRNLKKNKMKKLQESPNKCKKINSELK